jgi:hypothetical protein
MDIGTMAEEHKIVIQQSLHGYNGGHKLLSSSIDLSESEKRIMVAMSDYSGSGIEKGFLEYLTGYPIPSSKFFVFAKTWYADEMKRPGCVWTHSLLIDVTDLWSIRNTDILLSQFKRPSSFAAEHLEYSMPLTLNIANFRSSNSEVPSEFYYISCELYSKPNKGLVILSDSSAEYEEVLLTIWQWQWPKMKRNFTFSTGSLSLRKYDNRPFDLQILPYKRERTISGLDTEVFNIVDLEKKNDCKTNWIEDYKVTDLSQLQQFMVRFGADVTGSRTNFTSLFKAFKKNLQRDINLSTFKEFFKTNFTEPSEARILKSSTVEHMLAENTVDKAALIRTLMSDDSFNKINWSYQNIIIPLVNKGSLNDEELIDILSMLNTPAWKNDLISVLQKVKPIFWFKVPGLTNSDYSTLLSTKEGFERDPTFWKYDQETQDKIFSVLENMPTTDWKVVVHAMLDANSVCFANKIFEKIKAATIPTLIQWVLYNNKPLPEQWSNLIRRNKEAFIHTLSSQSTLNNELLKVFLTTLSPFDEYWRDISLTEVEKILMLVNQIDQQREATGIYIFFLTVCYENNFSQPEELNILIFQPLHDKLEDNFVHHNSWERFRWTVGKDLYGLIEQNYLSKLFNDRNRIPEWDHCEFLRRAIVAVFVKYRWNPITLIRAVPRKATFERIVEFGVQVDDGYRMFKKLYLELRLTGSTSFHYKVLKNLV